MRASELRVAGVCVAAGAALSISISNISLPTFYENGGNVQVFMTGRYIVSIVLALLVIWIGRLLNRNSIDHTRPMTSGETNAALISGIVYGAGALSVLGSIALIPVSLAILILFTFPVLTVVIQVPFERRMPNIVQLVFLATALLGVGVALDVGASAPNRTGVLMASGGALMVAISFVINARALAGVNSFTVAVSMSLSGLGVVAGFALATKSFAIPDVAGPGMSALAVAVGFGAIAFLAIFWAVRAIGATPTAMTMSLEPVFTILLSIWVLQDTVSIQRIFGAAMVVGAVLASQWVAGRTDVQHHDGTVRSA